MRIPAAEVEKMGYSLGVDLGTAYTADFNAIQGLFWVLLVVTLGSRTVDGAVNAGMAFVLLPRLLEFFNVPSDIVSPIQFAFFGFGAVTFARHQEGIVEFQKRFRWSAEIFMIIRRGRIAILDPDADRRRCGRIHRFRLPRWPPCAFE